VSPPTIIAIAGATATGKSALAMALAARLGGEIVNADALQLYRGFDVGTAKPSAAERAQVRHHLIDILAPAERSSAGEYARRARAALADIAARDRVAIVVGGSGLYWRALFSGLSFVPPGEAAVRQTLRERLRTEGLPVLRRELLERDPQTAARLAAGDTQRVLRALEVAMVSGRPLSVWLEAPPSEPQSIASLQVGLTLPRSILYDRIAGRVAGMLENGWVEEVRGLIASGLDPNLPAFQAIGYRQLVRYVHGEWSFEQAVDETIRATRRFAKRQETWFRKEPDLIWFRSEDVDRLLPQVLGHVKH
jgi:tRNA dimethylallyltransferase